VGDAPRKSALPWYVLGGFGIFLMVSGVIETAVAIWQGVFLMVVPGGLMSALGWFLYRYAELSATGEEDD
jgi:hypothetical protein